MSRNYKVQVKCRAKVNGCEVVHGAMNPLTIQVRANSITGAFWSAEADARSLGWKRVSAFNVIPA